MKRHRTTATPSFERCQRCLWTELSHRYADEARGRFKGRNAPPYLMTPWPCPEFVRPVPKLWSWRQIGPVGWFVLSYIAVLLGVVTVARWLTS